MSVLSPQFSVPESYSLCKGRQLVFGGRGERDSRVSLVWTFVVQRAVRYLSRCISRDFV